MKLKLTLNQEKFTKYWFSPLRHRVHLKVKIYFQSLFLDFSIVILTISSIFNIDLTVSVARLRAEVLTNKG